MAFVIRPINGLKTKGPAKSVMCPRHLGRQIQQALGQPWRSILHAACCLGTILIVLIDIRNSDGRDLYTVEVDEKQRPAKVRPPEGHDGPDVYLEWDRALDDRQCLRRCPVCGCWDLHLEKTVPQLTLFVVVLGVAVILLAVLDMGPLLVRTTAALMVLLLLGDLAIRFLLPATVRCYLCHSRFHRAAVPRWMAPWHPAIAERYEGVVRSSMTPTRSQAAPPARRATDNAKETSASR